MRYAMSTDGFHWQPLNSGRPYLVPKIGAQKLMRDPCIDVGPDGVYRVVWTVGWTGDEIGYASSSDLIHWGPQQALPVMRAFDGVKNCWAPELFYDRANKIYMIYWSSAVGDDWSIYYTTTHDFKQFADSKVLFTNGFSGGGKAGDQGPIDAFIFAETDADYILFYKKDDNSRVPNLYYRRGPSAVGPWGEEFGPITPSRGDEGPSCIKVGDEYRVYVDPLDTPVAYVHLSNDLRTWRRRTTNLKMSHGTVREIPSAVAEKLLTESAQGRPSSE